MRLIADLRLRPGKTYTGKYRATVNDIDKEKRRRLNVVVDAGNHIAKCDENNNTASAPLDAVK